jgi:2'-5' RNA ligase
VFPVEAPLADVLAQAESAAGATRAFPFTLRTARAVRDASGAGGHVFLVPEQGTQEVVVLHAALYSGALSWAHREDIPYVPHITVGAYADFDRCEALAHELEDGQINMSGRVDRVSVVEIGSSVETIAAFRLGGTISDPVA